MCKSCERPVDLVQRAGRTACEQRLDGLRQQEECGRQGHRRHESAEQEHRAPAAASRKQGRCAEAAQDCAGGIAGNVERDVQAATAVIRELGDHRARRRDHAADPQPREKPGGRERRDAGRHRSGEHAERHHRQAGEDDRPAADAIGDIADQRRAHGHAEQFHRQDHAQRRLVDPPIGRDSRRGEADRQHIEAVERIQRDAQAHDHDLQSMHGRIGKRRHGISVHLSGP